MLQSSVGNLWRKLRLESRVNGIQISYNVTLSNTKDMQAL